MDMLTPQALGPASDARDWATLDRLAQALDCSTDRFFEAAGTRRPKDVSQLVQVWLAIGSQEGRDAVFAFANAVLRAEER